MNLALAAGTFAVIIPAELPDKTFISAIILSSKHRPFPVWVGTAAGLVVQAAVGVAAGRLLALLPHRTVEGIVAGLFLLGAAYLLFVPERSAETKGAAAATGRGGTRWRRRGATAGAGEAGAGAGGAGAGGDAVGVTGAGQAGVEGPAAPLPPGPAAGPRGGGPLGGGPLDGGPLEGGPNGPGSGEAERSPFRVALMAFGIVTLAEFGDLTQVIVANLTARTRDPWSVFAGAAVAFVVISAVGVAAGRTLTRYVPLALVRRLSGLALAGLGAWSLVTALGG